MRISKRKLSNKAERVCELMALTGHDVLCIAKDPNDEPLQGAVFMFGAMNEEPNSYLCARRLLTELKRRFEDANLELEFTLKQKRKEVK